MLWLAGVGLAPYVAAPYWLWLAAAGLALTALILLWPKLRLRWALAALVALSLGAARYASALPPLGDPGFVATYNDRGPVTLEGVIDGEVITVETDSSLRLRAERLWLPDAAEPI